MKVQQSLWPPEVGQQFLCPPLAQQVMLLAHAGDVAFFPKDRCFNGSDCNFCHFEHDKRRRKKNKRRAKATELASVSTQGINTIPVLSNAPEDPEIVVCDSSENGSTTPMSGASEAQGFRRNIQDGLCQVDSAQSDIMDIEFSTGPPGQHMACSPHADVGYISDSGFTSQSHLAGSSACPYGIMGPWELQTGNHGGEAGALQFSAFGSHESPAWTFMDHMGCAEAWTPCHSPGLFCPSPYASDGVPYTFSTSMCDDAQQTSSSQSSETHKVSPETESIEVTNQDSARCLPKLRIRGKVRQDFFRRPVFAGA
jgi:hypothetical protein